MTAVLIAFGPQRVEVAVFVQPGRALSLNGREYVERPLRKSFLGFYDWLRTAQVQVVGLQLTPLDDGKFLDALLSGFDYVLVESPGRFRIMFVDPVSVDEQASGDQDFGESRVYFSSSGELLLSFDAAALSDAEMRDPTQTAHDDIVGSVDDLVGEGGGACGTKASR